MNRRSFLSTLVAGVAAPLLVQSAPDPRVAMYERARRKLSELEAPPRGLFNKGDIVSFDGSGLYVVTKVDGGWPTFTRADALLTGRVR